MPELQPGKISPGSDRAPPHPAPPHPAPPRPAPSRPAPLFQSPPSPVAHLRHSDKPKLLEGKKFFLAPSLAVTEGATQAQLASSAIPEFLQVTYRRLSNQPLVGLMVE